MKKLQVAVAAILCMAICGCGNFTISNQNITSVVSLGTALAFKYALHDQAKRTVIAKYVSGIAGAVRGLTGNETADQVAADLAANVPPEVMQQYPEIGTIVIPQVVAYYETAKQEFGTNVKAFLERMGAVASGLEQGVAAYTQ